MKRRPGEVMKVIVDEEAAFEFRIRRLSEDDAIVEQARVGTDAWSASDDATASRVYMSAFLALDDLVEEFLSRAADSCRPPWQSHVRAVARTVPKGLPTEDFKNVLRHEGMHAILRSPRTSGFEGQLEELVSRLADERAQEGSPG